MLLKLFFGAMMPVEESRALVAAQRGEIGVPTAILGNGESLICAIFRYPQGK
jgi:hypothetical protein